MSSLDHVALLQNSHMWGFVLWRRWSSICRNVVKK